ncbi:hypothetical protein [Actinomadura chokoriensis]|uniref:hypothetical protein n=1 Tax=Actinomadura chokoriensis TaxID=454156 RepID=UPI0031F7877C
MITDVAAQSRLPDEIDTGRHNYDADRTAAQFVLDVAPEMADVARENVHETAQRLDPGAGVVYVDHDPPRLPMTAYGAIGRVP